MHSLGHHQATHGLTFIYLQIGINDDDNGTFKLFMYLTQRDNFESSKLNSKYANYNEGILNENCGGISEVITVAKLPVPAC